MVTIGFLKERGIEHVKVVTADEIEEMRDADV